MLSHCSTMFHRWCFMLWIMSCSKPSPYFFLPVILVQDDINFSCPKNAFPEVVWLFLDVFWQSLIWPCLQLVVKPLYLLSWSLLLIVDLQGHVYLLESVLHLAGCCERVFFTMERILRSSTTVVRVVSVDVQAFLNVAELTSAFFFSQNVPHCWFGHS